ncbi:MAG TPA: sigma-70 family RNA polymerase sigma factor, partial [Planctomycetes bacterium]|nr:sigma-70 family RNA polymerase sigma factor [Planctomycetota bacterium]
WTIFLRNAAHNLRRSGVRRRAREQSAVPPATDSTPGPFDLAVFEERRRDLIAVVETLPPAQRDVVLARYWQGMEPAEIARRNKERPAAVRQRLQRAIDNLRQRLDRRVQSDRAAWLLPLMLVLWKCNCKG